MTSPLNTLSTGGKILVVDDEPAIVDAVATALRYEGFEVEEAVSGRDALSTAISFEPDLIVLDWMLPDIDGIEVGRRLRERGFRTAILFLTAKGGVENKVEALRAGGDDYVTKPFSLAEIVARVQAILRRTAGDLPGDVLRFGDLVLDEGRHEVFRAETRIELTATEFTCSASSCSTRAACSRRARSSRTSGATTSAATRTSSRPTSATCAASSTPPGRR